MTLNIISNFAANTALRNLQINGDEATKSVAKLSSGSRVVTAADDAAALAIGTRLNTEVRSLEQAAINAGQAVSLLQIADGGLSRVQEILTRTKVLAVQAGSDNLSDTERALLDTEFQNLKLEIDRLTKDTKFNGISILASEFDIGAGGSSGVSAFGGALTEGDTNGVLELSVRGVDNRSLTLGGDGQFTVTLVQGVADSTAAVTTQNATAGTDLTFTAIFQFGDLDAAGNADVVVKSTTVAGSLLVGNGGTGVSLDTVITIAFVNDNADFSSACGLSSETAKNAAVTISLDPAATDTANFDLANAAGLFNGAARSAQQTYAAFTPTTGTSGAVDFDFKVGTGIISDEDEINIKIGGVTVEQLGLTNADILTANGADSASEAVSSALDFLVAIRSDVGASINRLETAGDNIAISQENLEAARSRLLDLNVAQEITTFTSKQILLQSGISVLAQSNQLPQNLLRLFA